MSSQLNTENLKNLLLDTSSQQETRTTGDISPTIPSPAANKIPEGISPTIPSPAANKIPEGNPPTNSQPEPER